MKIRAIDIKSQVILAPMAGYSDLPFRLICKEMGAGIVYSEFVSSEGLIRGSEKTEFYLVTDEKERPLGIQIFGHDPVSMSESARYVEDKFHPDIIDINFGCSVRKVVKKNAGSALLKDLSLLENIIKQVVRAVSTPVTGKIRLGWDHDHYVGLEVAKILEDNGAEAITVHGRTASDGFGNTVKRDFIKTIKENVRIPVIGNGDIITPFDAEKMLNETGCDAVMIGRGAIGNPWLIQNTCRHLKGLSFSEPKIEEKIDLCVQHLQMEIEHRGEEFANKIMRKFYGGYFKGFEGASRLRHALVTTKTIAESLAILKGFRNHCN
ncbi:MAG: tRNA dihydrouridine synthase DusB [Candidatus Marinimicrobia bacterium]|nr:tRNA dihydrouridine synthase DusB [Candidatus Neomarinimicrobiota bacterium]